MVTEILPFSHLQSEPPLKDVTLQCHERDIRMILVRTSQQSIKETETASTQRQVIFEQGTGLLLEEGLLANLCEMEIPVKFVTESAV